MAAELSASSKLAFRWARAIRRAGEGGVGSFDLLAGILLAHVADSEPRQLLDHFGIPLGAVLGGSRRYDGDKLLAAVRRLPADALPPRSPDVERILARARETPDPDGLVPLRTLFGALLELENPASTTIRRELTARGVDADAVVASYRDFLTSQRPYGAFLRDRHPPPRRELPAYQTDQPRKRRPPEPGLVEPDDLVDIRAEVDAFAYLIASHTLEPPLAIGLFGDWGSGKSFFLRSLQRRIDDLIKAQRSPQALPFYRDIVQIEFNAWQYVEGNLWASLIEHLFRNLRTSSDDDRVAERQRYWIKQLQVTDERREELEKERQTVAAEIERLRDDPLAEWKPSEAFRASVQQAAERAGLPEVAAEAEKLQATLAQARDVLRRANPVLQPLRRRGWRPAAMVIIALALIPALSWALDRLDWSAVSNATATLAWVLASATAYVKWGASIVQDGLADIGRAEEELRGRHEQVEDELQRLAVQAAEVEAQLAAITPASVLAGFLAERVGSDDYRRHLGVPALIRRDLERLSNLVEQQNRRLQAGAPPRKDEYPINRIVLYIDDLDRCPQELVIQVLQAVHLLLAFPLFVVVVAVDARWLAGSLKEHYGTLLEVGQDGASPDDYLEKIFQVPFWVQPLDAATRRRMARGLLTPSLVAGAPGTSASERAPDPLDEVDPDYLALIKAFSDAEAPGRAWLEAARLEVTEQELALIDDVAPLLGDTPRSVKRFANVYQLMKSMSRPWPRATDGTVILLLAIAIGLPDLARELFDSIERHENGPFPLAETVEQLEIRPAEQLADWLGAHEDFRTLDTPNLPYWTALIRRFSFRLGSG